MESHADKCVNCDRRLDGLSLCCSGCKTASYCTEACVKAHWLVHREECLQGDSLREEPPSYDSVAFAPTHNLGHIEVQREKELVMMEQFCNWRNMWYKTITKCTLSRLSCDPQGLKKLRTHGLAIWVSRRADLGNLDDSKSYIRGKASRHEWAWNEDWWTEATSFKIEYARLVPWDHLVEMLESIPMDESFLNSFRELYMPNQLRIVAFLAPSFLSYDNVGVWKRHSSRLPQPRWTFPVGSKISAPAQDLIMRTMPFFEPFVTGYDISRTDFEEATDMRYSHFDSDSWEWIIKQVVEQGWYSNDGRAWRGLIDRIACMNCKGKAPIPSSEVKAGLAFLSKMEKQAGRSHIC